MSVATMPAEIAGAVAELQAAFPDRVQVHEDSAGVIVAIHRHAATTAGRTHRLSVFISSPDRGPERRHISVKARIHRGADQRV